MAWAPGIRRLRCRREQKSLFGRQHRRMPRVYSTHQRAGPVSLRAKSRPSLAVALPDEIRFCISWRGANLGSYSFRISAILWDCSGVSGRRVMPLVTASRRRHLHQGGRRGRRPRRQGRGRHPRRRPRNPATIADNVGDNVGDCAGMAADLFESYEVTLVASIILGVPAFQAIFPHSPELWAIGALFPLARAPLGLLASIVGVFAVRATDKDKSAMAPINRGFLTAGILTVLGTLAPRSCTWVTRRAARSRAWGLRMFGAVVAGLVLAEIACRVSPSTSPPPRPSRCGRSRESANTGGPATAVLAGMSSGLESSVWAIVAIAGAIVVAIGSAATTSSSRSTWSRSPAWACSRRPVSSCRRTPSDRSPTTRRASPRCRASSKVSRHASW